MSRKARIWVGVTLLVMLAFNYAMIGVPLFRRAASLENKSNTMLAAEMKKSGKALKYSDDYYILEILRREKTSLDRKIFILNVACASALIIIASWTIFGLVFYTAKTQKSAKMQK